MLWCFLFSFSRWDIDFVFMISTKITAIFGLRILFAWKRNKMIKYLSATCFLFADHWKSSLNNKKMKIESIFTILLLILLFFVLSNMLSPKLFRWNSSAAWNLFLVRRISVHLTPTLNDIFCLILLQWTDKNKVQVILNSNFHVSAVFSIIKVIFYVYFNCGFFPLNEYYSFGALNIYEW